MEILFLSRSDIVGLTTVKRDKYSVFNFLNFGADYQPSENQEPTKESNVSKSSGKTVYQGLKPVAIMTFET